MDHHNHELVPPTSASQFSQSHTNPFWTSIEDKIFETAILDYPDSTPNRWECIAALIPGNLKSPLQVSQHYQDLVDDLKNIEDGLVPLPVYKDDVSNEDDDSSSDDNDLSVEPRMVEERKNMRASGKSRKTKGKGVERKKGKIWTEEEHRLFLDGLKIYGKGDWKNISRNIVRTKTASQIASHAQKYFEHEKRKTTTRTRRSIHDIRIESL